MTTHESRGKGIAPSSSQVIRAALREPDRMPLSIPRSQLYFWSREWQEAERQSCAELEQGQGKEFSSLVDVIRWLFSSDDARRTREHRVQAVCVVILLAACGLAIWLALLGAW